MEEKEDACNALGEIAINVGCVVCVCVRIMKVLCFTDQCELVL